jgi:hypothetical protein
LPDFKLGRIHSSQFKRSFLIGAVDTSATQLDMEMKRRMWERQSEIAKSKATKLHKDCIKTAWNWRDPEMETALSQGAAFLTTAAASPLVKMRANQIRSDEIKKLTK